MKSKKIIISYVGGHSARPTDHFPDGYSVFLDCQFRTSKEAMEFLGLVRSAEVWVSNEQPYEFKKDKKI